jgi:hypothetical protein
LTYLDLDIQFADSQEHSLFAKSSGTDERNIEFDPGWRGRDVIEMDYWGCGDKGWCFS